MTNVVFLSPFREILVYFSTAREATLSRKSSLAFLSKGSSPMYKSKNDLHKSLLFTLPTWLPSTEKKKSKNPKSLDTLSREKDE